MTTSQRVLPHIGERIQRYELIEELGRGGFGVVFRARQHGLDIDVALKVVLPHDSAEAATLQLYERFQQEADIAKQLRHPNAIKVHDYGRTPGGLPFLVSEYVRGRGLEEVIGQQGISLERTIKIAMQVLGCLAEAHHRQIIHRDLKPANIMLQDMVGESDHVKVLDFGIAKLAEQAGGLQTQTGHAMGTPYYMSPEQCRGMRDIDGRSDLYSLGLVMAECLSGRRVVQTTDWMGAYYEHAKEEPHLFDRVVEQSPLFPIVRTATAKDRDDRFPGALAMREALEHLRVTLSQHALGLLPTTMPGPTLAPSPTPLSTSARRLSQSETVAKPGPAETRSARPLSTRRWVAIVVALVVVGAIVMAAWPRPDSTGGSTPPRESDREVTEADTARTTEPEEPVSTESTEVAVVRVRESFAWARRELQRAVPPTRNVRITASEAAEVRFGDTPICETPCELRLPTIDHEIVLTLRRTGFQDRVETVNLATFRGLDVELQALAGERLREQEHSVDPPEDEEPERAEIRRLTVPTGIRRLTVPGSEDDGSETPD